VYTASCGALAILEYMAHLSVMPKDMLLYLIEVPDSLPIERMSGWAPVDILASRQIGDEWINHRASLVLEVPSVLAPRQKNYLINPLHPVIWCD
jgi:RES domain-containing protein